MSGKGAGRWARRARQVRRHLTGHLESAAWLPLDVLAAVAALLSAGMVGDPLRSRLTARWAQGHRHRLARWRGTALPPPPTGRRLISYAAGRVGLGAVGLAIVAAVVGLLAAGADVIAAACSGQAAPLFDAGPGDVTWRTVALLLPPTPLVLFVLAQGARGVADLEIAWFRRCAVDRDAVEADLRRTRREVLDAVDAERRRIERALHDGVQQSVVSLGLLVGRARLADDAGTRGELLAQAHDQSFRLLADLRDVVWRIYPAVLDAHGLSRALAELAEASRTPVRVRYDAPPCLPETVQAAAYFTAAEALTNAQKHAAATQVEIDVRLTDGVLTVQVRDDGRGGADLDGPGLRGLRARSAALDGALTVTSPAGGPTVIRMVAPCG